MKTRQVAARIAAAVSSISIVTVYVSCRTHDAKPAEGQPTTRGTEFMGGSKSKEIFAPPPAPSTQPHMGGSKSMVIVNPGDLPARTPTQAPK